MEKIHHLSAVKLDILVAEAIGIKVFFSDTHNKLNYIPRAGMTAREWAPSRFWSQGGPLVEQHKIDLNWGWEESKEWTASIEPDINVQGATVLEAAMRALVCLKLPDFNDIPS
ncbi:MAG: DUF2591 domain-containing protein [gamma proteobacterium symbiont of Bathyaustriella thionipta]|nr:DUF2591 domain-containing protein [gamma proteobacterium symbiont of Bathyaustriella thionipta]MCU7950038.1 DUF2591 domain-containing protein [gamma proteobacterium symbiont of Bathyaustriella thionipta]MCU7954280.1 DUF2591 domain-containing protein [gamma proteobacterium symbiont of Bathyaustriella thionipta]MCU7956627.1 DUF2591 domain-containing protein [gamma proteobacterium symbiont of Bathyaustriella thionipta]MCU7969020.1 DUF2591 domain-containing protein [gamma proteobacterium symbion